MMLSSAIFLAVAAAAPRLSTDVAPDRYVIALDVADYATANTFSGQETIYLRLGKPTDTIVLSARDLQLIAVVANADGTAPVPGTFTIDATAQTATLHFAHPLTGLANVKIDWKAPYGPLRGLYKAKHGTQMYLGTQLESADARRVFPSFDELQSKATYALTVTAPAGLTVLSNTVGTATVKGAQQAVVFSRHRAAVVLPGGAGRGPYEPARRQIKTQKGTLDLAVWAPHGQTEYAGLALDTAEQVIPWFERYFAQPFPFPKLDMVAIPDFEFGGMENAGAIFYDTAALLLDKKSASPERLRRVAGVVAHEIAHQWFGDLVTMKWWDDLWLNESFATWADAKAVEALHPDWKYLEDFQEERTRAFRSDELRATHAIHQPIADVAETEASIDGITYQKGASVLFMLEAFLGPDAFRQGVRGYMAAHRYGNATEADLWRALEEQTGKPVRQIATSWVDRPGFPVVKAQVSCAGGQATLTLTQRRADDGGSDGADREVGAKAATATDYYDGWKIPICARSASGEHCTLLTKESGTLAMGACSPWTVVNSHRAGFYRVQYGAAELAALTTNLTQLDPTERFALLDDALDLATVGQLDVSSLLALLDAESAEMAPLPLEAVESTLEALDQSLVPDADRAVFRRAVDHLLVPVVAVLDWRARKGEGEDARRARPGALETLGTLGQPPQLVKEARERAERVLKGTALEPAEANAALTIAAHTGDGALWEGLRRGLDSKAPEEHERAVETLPLFEDPVIVERTLDLVATRSIGAKDRARLIGGLLSGRASRAATWTFLQLHWSELAKKMPVSSSVRLAQRLARLCEPSASEEITHFFQRADVHAPGQERSIQLGLEGNARCVRMKRNMAAGVHAWLIRPR